MKKNNTITGELIYGVHPIVECLKAKRRKLISIYTTKPHPRSFEQIERLLPHSRVPIQYVTHEVLHKMAGTTDHQSVIAWVQTFPFRNKEFDPQRQKFIVMLDGIQDPRNLGAIIRSSYCAGADGIVICKKAGAPLTGAAVKAAAGLCEHMEIMLAPSPVYAAKMLSDAGYNLYMAVFNGEVATQVAYQEPLCLVIGNEAIGISKEVVRFGTPVTLPQRSIDISYNASVAAGILLFHIGINTGRI